MTAQPRSPHIAKISPPRLPRILQRQRLFAELEQALRQPAVWVCGPAGSGKTTLVASFLEARRLPALWYQVDRNDEDLATFFHYLGIAARHASPRKRGAMPLLTRGYLASVDKFVQRFFEALSRRLDRPIALVFDDCHQLPAEAPVYAALREVLANLPEGINAIFISRSEPPPTWARLRANQALRVLGWDQLRLTPAETSALYELLTGRALPPETLDGLHGEVQGWVAGLVLLLEQGELPAMPALEQGHANLTAVFDYFAGEIFQRQETAIQEFLLKTAVLRRITVPVAERLTGNPRAGRILRDLARANFFTIQHGGGDTFEYHPLFLDFLRHRLQRAYGPGELATLQREAGRLLAAEGDVDGAAELFLRSRDWDQLAALLHIHARDLLKQGRYRTLQGWVKSLPTERLAVSPWLSYWLGLATQAYDPMESRGYLEQAYRGFRRRHEPIGSYLAWAAAVDTCLQVWGAYKHLDYWLDEFEDLRRQYPEYPSLELEARVSYCMLNALMRRRPTDPGLHGWSESAEAMLQRDISLSYRTMIGNSLLLYHLRWTGNLQRAELIASVMRTFRIAGQVAPLAELTWWMMEGAQRWANDDPDGCRQAVESGLARARALGVHLLDFMFYTLAASASLCAGDPAAAEAYLAEMPESLRRAINKDGLTYYHLLSAQTALYQNDLVRAREHAELVHERLNDSEAPLAMIMDMAANAQVLIETGAHALAAKAIRMARSWCVKLNSPPYLDFHLLLCEAELALAQRGEQAALRSIRRAMSFGRARGYFNHPWLGWRRPLLTRLYTLALAHGIETEYVRELVRRQRLVPADPPQATVAWPWPIRIFSLGRCELLVDDQPLNGKRSLRGKPLELLQALIAHGGENVAEQTLTDHLWPDTDGDAAHHALETTLYRLRKLIGNEQALVLQNGRLSLNARYCWLDLWAVQQLLRELDAQLRQADDAALRRSAAQLRELYGGPLLYQSGDGGWLLLPRERLQTQLHQAVLRLGTFWEERGDWHAAAELYAWWQEQQPQQEELCRRLMLCYRQLGRLGEARAVYHAYAATLRKASGREPAPAIRGLYMALETNEPAG